MMTTAAIAGLDPKLICGPSLVAAFLRSVGDQRGGSAKLRMRSPPRRPRSPPPEATATNSWPLTAYTDGDENTPDPVLNFQSSSPVFASNAKKYPATLLPVPTKTTSPAVTTEPAWPKPSKILRHFNSPVVGS